MPGQSKNIILSLFDRTGTWSRPWSENGFEVIQVDIENGIDILNWDFTIIPRSNVYGILAAPPCTHFTHASSIFWARYDANGDTAKSLVLIQTTLEIIKYFNPLFWCLENPPGRLRKIHPPIAKYLLHRFRPSDYGDPLFKLTELYGDFCPFLVQSPIKPTHIVGETKLRPSIMSYYKKKYPGFNRAALRSITPPGFANAFYHANKNLNNKN